MGNSSSFLFKDFTLQRNQIFFQVSSNYHLMHKLKTPLCGKMRIPLGAQLPRAPAFSCIDSLKEPSYLKIKIIIS